MTEEEALSVLREAEWGVLSTVTPQGIPYGLPINYALEGRSLYMHCTTDGGQKIDNILADPRACMTTVTGVSLHSRQLTTSFRSAMAFGSVHILSQPEEKREGLRPLLRRLAPEYEHQDPDCMDDGPLSHVLVLRMDIDSVSGKLHL